MIALLFATCVVGLIIGPLLLRLPSKHARWMSVLDGFILVGVGGIAALHLLPEAITSGGWIAVLMAVVGAVLPTWFEHRAARVGAGFASALLLCGLLPHVALESAALRALSMDQKIVGMLIAVAAHRLPVGMVLYSTVQKRFGHWGAWGAIGLMIAATAGGLFAGDVVSSWLPVQGVSLLQALVGGSLLHVAFASHFLPDELTHSHEPSSNCYHCVMDEEKHGLAGFWSAIGGLIGGFVLIFVLMFGHAHHHAQEAHAHAADHHHHHVHVEAPGFVDVFWTLLCQSAPALLIAVLGAGVLGVGVRAVVGRWLGHDVSLDGFGLPLSLTSCGVLPFYQMLIERGVPATVALVFLIGMPSLGLGTLLLSFALLGATFTVSWLVVALLMSLLGAWAVGRLVAGHPHTSTPPQELHDHVRAGMRFGLIDVFDHMMPWALVGLLLAAIGEPLFSHQLLAHVPAIIQVTLFSLVAIPFYVCATGASPVAAVAVHKGISPGAVLAFLLIGPSTSKTTMQLLTQLHGKRVAIGFVAVLVMVAISAGLVVDTLAISALSQLHTHHHTATWYEMASVLFLGLLFTLSLFRHGPRGLLAHLVRPAHEHV